MFVVDLVPLPFIPTVSPLSGRTLDLLLARVSARLHLYLSEERSARFLSCRERLNASTPATFILALTR